jgi:hypothetical protein
MGMCGYAARMVTDPLRCVWFLTLVSLAGTLPAQEKPKPAEGAPVRWRVGVAAKVGVRVAIRLQKRNSITMLEKKSDYERASHALTRAQVKLTQVKTVAAACKAVDEVETCLLDVRRALWSLRKAGNKILPPGSRPRCCPTCGGG